MAVTIYTGDFTQFGGNPRAVSIVKDPPNTFNGTVRDSLAVPDWIYKIYRQDGNTVAFTTRYVTHVLSKLSQRAIASHLGDGALLLSHEASWQFSARQVVAIWLMDDPNVICRELRCPLLYGKAWNDAR